MCVRVCVRVCVEREEHASVWLLPLFIQLLLVYQGAEVCWCRFPPPSFE